MLKRILIFLLTATLFFLCGCTSFDTSTTGPQIFGTPKDGALAFSVDDVSQAAKIICEDGYCLKYVGERFSRSVFTEQEVSDYAHMVSTMSGLGYIPVIGCYEKHPNGFSLFPLDTSEDVSFGYHCSCYEPSIFCQIMIPRGDTSNGLRAYWSQCISPEFLTDAEEYQVVWHSHPLTVYTYTRDNYKNDPDAVTEHMMFLYNGLVVSLRGVPPQNLFEILEHFSITEFPLTQ